MRSDLCELVRCPNCASRVTAFRTAPRFSNELCEYSTSGFSVVDGQPISIDFKSSVLIVIYGSGSGSVLRRDVSGRSVSSRLPRLTFGSNPVATENCSTFLSIIKQKADRPRVLVARGATIGSGAESLYADTSIELVSTDVFASQNTVLVGDATDSHLRKPASMLSGWKPSLRTFWSRPLRLLRYIGF